MFVPAASRAARAGRATLARPLAATIGRRRFYEDASPAGANTLYLESIYSRWKLDPRSLDPKWGDYFKAVQAGKSASPPASGSAARNAAVEARVSYKSRGVTSASPQSDILGMKYLIQAYQTRGHEVADLDPLKMHQWRGRAGFEDPGGLPELNPSYHGFTEADLTRPLIGSMVEGIATGGNVGFLAQVGNSTIGSLVEKLKATYCGPLGIEYMHMGDRKRRNWVRSRVENPTFLAYDQAKATKTFERLCYADSFENFCGEKFKLVKRFGIDGAEATIPGMKAMIDRAVELGVEEFNFGMPHRGRLNVLAGVLKKPMPQIFSEFQGTSQDVEAWAKELEEGGWGSAHDVKYHLGTSHVRTYPGGRKVKMSLEANPSHLETVNPVTLGRVRAKQYYLGDGESSKQRVMPILLHGDASFAGQGVNYETMQLAAVEDFNCGGTIHVVVNNQVGFTTDPKNSRSTEYCSDLGKAFNVPIFHVNADDPLAVVRAFELAVEWRQEWGSDVIVDVIAYRRFGHNETDNPDFTQPLLYKKIASHPRSEKVFAERLVQEGHLTQEAVDGIRKKVWDSYEADFAASATWQPSKADSWLTTNWKGFLKPTQVARRKPTGVDVELLRKIGLSLCQTKEGVTLHRVLKRQLDVKKAKLEKGGLPLEENGLDWGTCEALAFGSLLLEDNHVRITGQDVQRGTFSHRHAVVIDQKNESEYCFLNNMNLGDQERFVARNSVLSEYGVLGYELGYSYENPNALVIWEAQFGDFANTAQVMFDQYICAGEHKWMQQTALTMLLPHGYDGQGAEHSSARMERFLQSCDDDEDHIPEGDMTRQVQLCNWQVMNFSTPANYFHALRQQLHRAFRKPMVVASPKFLLRYKHCVSSLEDMGPDSRFLRLIPERNAEIAANPDKVTRLVFCTGKMYYELLAEREKLGLKNVALVTVEQIAPFPFDRVSEQIALYKNVDKGDGILPGDVLWCQEEPKNMGFWTYVRPRIATVAREYLDLDLILRYVGRRAAASPATGMAQVHALEQQAIVSAALSPPHQPGTTRASALLGHQT